MDKQSADSPNIIPYLIGIISLAWNIILGLLYVLWFSRVKSIDKTINSLKKDQEKLSEKESSNVSEIHKRIDATLVLMSGVKSDMAGTKEKLEGQIKICDRTQSERQNKKS